MEEKKEYIPDSRLQKALLMNVFYQENPTIATAFIIAGFVFGFIAGLIAGAVLL